MSRSSRLRPTMAALALLAGLAVIGADYAEARAMRGGSMGSRGSRTWSTPAPTPTAPSAQSMQRSATQPGQATQPGVANPAANAARPGGFLNRPGLMGGIMGGLLGAGLFGLLMGGGFFSGLGSLAGILGFLLQIVLIFIVVRLVMGWLRRRNEPSYAGGVPPGAMPRDAMEPQATPGTNLGGGSGRSGFGLARGRPLKLDGSDFDTFEQTLGEVQFAYARDDRAALARLTTPELAGYMGEQLDELARDGLVNNLADVKLLQGDLSEAWSEDGEDYATVAMRFELKDSVVERATGRLVQGDPDRLTQATEFWTFVRRPGGPWQVSAIQQG